MQLAERYDEETLGHMSHTRGTLLLCLFVTGSDSPVRDDSSTLIGSKAPCSCKRRRLSSEAAHVHNKQGNMFRPEICHPPFSA